MNKIIISLLIIPLMLSCNKNDKDSAEKAQRIFHTWNSLGEMDYGGSDVSLSLNTEITQQDFIPWAGIVSHHILAHDYIDAWFFQLSKMRSPKRFYILSPDHYNLSLEHYSLTRGAWDSGFGLVETDKKKVNELVKLLEVDIDDRVFEMEHGISVLIPYIKKHFPETEVVPIIISGDSTVNTYIIGRLVEVFENEFDEIGKQDNFLIISSDFSHGKNLEETVKNDITSYKYLTDTTNISWNNTICDNRPAIYILDRLGKKNLVSSIISHTSSYEIAGGEPSPYGLGGGSGVDDNITSYFFVYFGDREGICSAY